MFNYKFGLFGLILLGYASTASASCDNPENQLEMNYCAAEKNQSADKKLNAIYKKLMNKMETPEAKERLRDVQRAWITFRDASCNYEIGPREDSGSMWNMLQETCVKVYTEKRIKELESYLSCTDECPR